jgi:streptogramin lyase
MRDNHVQSLGSFGRCGLLLAMLLPAVAWAPPALAQLVTEYAIPTGNSQPHHITVGPDNNLWFTEFNGDKIGKITTAGVISEYALASGANPGGIVTGPDGNLWFTEHGGNQIGTMSTSGTVLATYTVPTAASGPGNIRVCHQNDSLCFFEETGNKLARFEIATSKFFECAVPTPNSTPFSGVKGPDGNFWFTESTGNNIGKQVPGTCTITEYATPSGTNPRVITVGPDNNLWFTLDGPSGNKIGQIVIANLPAMTIFQNPTGNSPEPYAIHSGPDGGLWFTEFNGNAIGRLTAAGVFTGYYPVPTSASEPRSMAVGPDNAIWFTETAGNNIGRIAPSIATTATHDFGGDNKSDILWQDTGGNVALWLMNGGQVSAAGSLGNVPTATWSIVGQHAFTGAAGGQSQTADILWRDTSGDVAMWFMNGLTISSAAGVATVPTNWNIYGTGDLNGDGKGDILWRDDSGNVAVWFMDGATISSAIGFGGVPTNWHIVGDGNGGILWRDDAGDIAVWEVKNGQVTAASYLGTVPSNWVIQGVGDFDGDGNIDILWRDTTSGTVAIWFLNNGQISSTASLGAVPGAWSIVQVGDYDGDGKSDILWKDSSGNVALWFMNGATIASAAGLGNVGTSWQVQNANAN